MKRNNYLILLMSSIFTVLNWSSTSALLLEDENCFIPSVFQGQKVTSDDRFFIKGEKDSIPSTPWNEAASSVGYTPDGTPIYPSKGHIIYY